MILMILMMILMMIMIVMMIIIISMIAILLVVLLLVLAFLISMSCSWPFGPGSETYILRRRLGGGFFLGDFFNRFSQI